MPIWFTGYSNPIAAILTFVFPDKSRLYNSFLKSVSNIQIPFKNTIFFLEKDRINVMNYFSLTS